MGHLYRHSSLGLPSFEPMSERPSYSVRGLPRFGPLLPWCVFKLRVYPWGVRLGPRSIAVSRILMIPRVEGEWASLGPVLRKGRFLRFLRPNNAAITFLALGRIGPVVAALQEHGVAVQAVDRWPSG